MAPKMGPRMLPGARRVMARRRLAQYNGRPQGFASDALLARTRNTIRQQRGHREPRLVTKLRSGLRWNRNDINADNHIALARFIAFRPADDQDTVMGLLMRAELPAWYLRRVITACQQITARQRALAQACPSNRVLVIAPDNVVFLSS